jgi:sec-independent protein translocase protein TatA
MLSRIGMGELLVLLIVVLLIFGPSRLPELAGSIGKSLKAFKKGMRDEKETEDEKKDAQN